MYGFMPVINKPTRILENSSSAIDNIFINFGSVAYSAGIIHEDITDHSPTVIVFLDIRNEGSHCFQNAIPLIVFARQIIIFLLKT